MQKLGSENLDDLLKSTGAQKPSPVSLKMHLVVYGIVDLMLYFYKI